MNSNYAMLGIKLYLANVQGKILTLVYFTLVGYPEQLAWQQRPIHSYNTESIRSANDVGRMRVHIESQCVCAFFIFH